MMNNFQEGRFETDRVLRKQANEIIQNETGLDMQEETKKYHEPMPQVSAINLISIQQPQFKFIEDLSTILKEVLGVRLDVHSITDRIIQGYRLNTSYISLVNITAKVKFSISEVNRLATLTDRERRTLDYMLMANRRNTHLTTLTELLKVELDIRDGVVQEYEGENLTVNKIWTLLENDYTAKYRNMKLGGGIKKLIIKSVIISYVLNDNQW